MNKKMYFFILFVLIFCNINALPSSRGDESISLNENSTDIKNDESESENQSKISETTENYVTEISNITVTEYNEPENVSNILNLNKNFTLYQDNNTSNVTDDENSEDGITETDLMTSEDPVTKGNTTKSRNSSVSDFSLLWNFFDILFGKKLPQLFSSDRKVEKIIDTSNKELAEISEILLDSDVNNVNDFVNLRTQMKIVNFTKDDLSPEPYSNLLLLVNDIVWKMPTISLIKEFYDNYEPDVNINETVTIEEKLEEDKFLDKILATPVMRRLTEFLTTKGVFTSDENQQKEVFAKAWFGLYPRMRGKITSSGFEHVFLSEVKKKKISGLHNWLYFNTEEIAQRANYLGYMRKIDLGTKGYILKFAFSLNGIYKPVNSMFIGTSPELEMALYSLCFFTRADRKCPIFLNGNKINVRTHSNRWEGNKLIASAFPEI